MTYKILNMTDSMGVAHRSVCAEMEDGSKRWFSDDESNDGPERAAYLAWVAEGNTPEVIE